MYGDDGPDDDYMTTDQALDSGWLTPEDAEELCDILKGFDLTHPKPGNREWAALILFQNKLRQPDAKLPGEVPRPDHAEWDAIVTWATVLLESAP